MVNYISLAMLIGGILLLIIGLWILIRYLKKKIKERKAKQINPNDIPKEVLDEFNVCEERIKNENITPQEIMWDLAKKHILKGGQNGKRIAGTGNPEVERTIESIRNTGSNIQSNVNEQGSTIEIPDTREQSGQNKGRHKSTRFNPI